MDVRRIERKAKREITSKPYGTKPAKKSSQWLTGLMGYIMPQKLIDSQIEKVEDPQTITTLANPEPNIREVFPTSPRTTLAAPHLSASQKLTERGLMLEQEMASPRTPTSTAHSQFFDSASPHELVKMSPAEKLSRIGSFLESKHGGALNEMEAMGILALTRGTSPESNSEFRFSNNSSRSVSRAATPDSHLPVNPFAPTAAIDSVTPNSARRMLSKNPNGDLHYTGAGSARPKRNRYASPAFGLPATSSSSTPIKIKMSPVNLSTKAELHNKRRRMSEEPKSSSTTVSPAVTFPIQNLPPPPASATAFDQKKFDSSSQRIRNTIAPTKPANPSPLRQSQTWETPSPPRYGSSPSGPNGNITSNVPLKPSTPTHAAAFMTSLLQSEKQQVKNKPDVSNPYQDNSPARAPTRKRPTRNLAKLEKSNTVDHKKLTDGIEKAAVSAKAKETEMSPVAIIEATLPKGSKRARAPPSLDKSASNSLRGSVNEVENQFLSTPTPAIPLRRSPRMLSPPPESKSFSSLNGFNHTNDKYLSSHKTKAKPTIEDDDEDNQPATPISSFSTPPQSIQLNGTSKSSITSASISATAPCSSSTAPNGGISKAFMPREPSKLRLSIQPEQTSKKSAENTAPDPVRELSFAARTTNAETKNAETKNAETKNAETKNAETKNAETKNAETKNAESPQATALKVALQALPVYTFALPNKVAYPASSSKARIAALDAKPSALPMCNFEMTSRTDASTSKPAFNWAAAGMKVPSKPVGGWTCSVCLCPNPASANERCSVCDELKEKSTPMSTSTPSAGFDWSAAGMKAPEKPAGTWTCSQCMCANTGSVGKCVVCETER